MLCIKGCIGGVDDVEGLPTEPSTYQPFVQRINRIVALSPGVRLVAGLSLGASLAAAAGEAVDSSGRALYTRQLIINPMLHLHPLKDIATTALNQNRLTRATFVGIPNCYTERETGRAGFCSYTIANGAAARDFGLSTLARLKAPNGTSVAVLYDEADDVVSTVPIRQLAAKYRAELGQNESASCVLPFTMHSFFSPYDNVPVNKWWTNEVDCAMVAFLARGKPFALGRRDWPEGNDPFCHLECNATRCPYDRHAPIVCPFLPPRLE